MRVEQEALSKSEVRGVARAGSACVHACVRACVRLSRTDPQSCPTSPALARAQAMLEEDSQRFDAFLKENDEKVQEAIRRADAEAKAKQDKVRGTSRTRGQTVQEGASVAAARVLVHVCARVPACGAVQPARSSRVVARAPPGAGLRTSSAASSQPSPAAARRNCLLRRNQCESEAAQLACAPGFTVHQNSR